MKNEAQIRDALIENTIHLIAQGGFEKATTRNIAQGGSDSCHVTLNDAYIYRIFGSKEGLYAEAFAKLDRELNLAMCRRLDIMEFGQHPIFEDMYYLWDGIWNFVLRNEERCRCYTRYYYSVYLREGSLRRHRESFQVIADRMRGVFKEEADVTAILHSALTTILSFAVRVYNGDIVNNEVNSKHVFNIVWCSLSTYLKET